MAYQVLARRWRPHIFSEVVGQEPVLRALIHALDSGRLHHAFLFTGTRGVGKTTIARILAKSLNCERGVSSKPCGTCGACQEIDEARFVDLIEVDAASKTKVEDTRELLEKVQYTPSRGRYKVYLIDEVHMFSNHSFNALLKTLEEPPPHVKFLLATTDPQRLPVTVLSRCLQFNLRRLSLPLIQNYLAKILNEDGIPFEEVALQELARAADGSMRDGLSLLDQAISHGGERVLAADVYHMLGTLPRDRVFSLLEALASGDARLLLELLESMAQYTPDWGGLLGELTGLVQKVALAQFVPDALDDTFGDRERMLALAKKMTPEEVQLQYQIALVGRRDLSLAPQPRGGFEMVLLRMLAFRPLLADTQNLSKTVVQQPSTYVPAKKLVSAPTPSVPKVATTPPPPSLGDIHWSELVPSLSLIGFSHQVAMNCSLIRVEGQTLHLLLEKRRSMLLNKERAQQIEEAVQNRFGQGVRVIITIQDEVSGPVQATPAQIQERTKQEKKAEAQAVLEADPRFRELVEAFDAEVVSPND
ncbi:DNA polymerase III subunit tau [Gammaproteobacteria bacterium]